MNRLDCEIVKDLIPSYLDGICSESSREAVEYHLMSCQECRKHLEILQSPELTAVKTNQQELDFMKKVKLYFSMKNSLGVGLLFMLSLAVILILPSMHLAIELELYCALFTILTLGTFLLLSNYQEKPKRSRLRAAAATVSALGILCSLGVGALMLHVIYSKTVPLGMEIEKTGPLLNQLLLGIIFVELLIFVGYAVNSVRGEHSFGILPTLNLAGCILCMSYRSFLFHMDTPESLEIAIWQITLLVFLITLCVVMVEFALLKIRSRLSQK